MVKLHLSGTTNEIFQCNFKEKDPYALAASKTSETTQ